MESKTDVLFVYRALTLLMLIMIVSALGGLGLVWLRQKTSKAAAHTQSYEVDLAALERNMQYLEARIAEEEQPELLKQRAQNLGLELQQPAVSQVVRFYGRRPIEEEPVVTAEPFAVSYDFVVHKAAK